MVNSVEELDGKVLSLAQKLWDYHRIDDKLMPADVIVVFCSNDIRLVEYVVSLYKKGLAPLIMFSGGVAHQGDLLNTGWNKSEAEVFADKARELGVPEEAILLDAKATNTQQNVENTYSLLQEKGVPTASLIIAQKPFMQRRAYATFKMFWPEKKTKVMFTAPDISLEEYLATSPIPAEDIVNIIVGDLQRIREYPKKGFQIPQEIPDDVWNAYEQLVKMGYTKHLIKE